MDLSHVFPADMYTHSIIICKYKYMYIFLNIRYRHVPLLQQVILSIQGTNQDADTCGPLVSLCWPIWRNVHAATLEMCYSFSGFQFFSFFWDLAGLEFRCDSSTGTMWSPFWWVSWFVWVSFHLEWSGDPPSAASSEPDFVKRMLR